MFYKPDKLLSVQKVQQNLVKFIPSLKYLFQKNLKPGCIEEMARVEISQYKIKYFAIKICF